MMFLGYSGHGKSMSHSHLSSHWNSMVNKVAVAQVFLTAALPTWNLTVVEQPLQLKENESKRKCWVLRLKYVKLT